MMDTPIKLIDQPTSKTVRKVEFSARAAAITALLVALVVYFIPAWMGMESIAALTLLLSPLVSYLTTWASGYYARAREGELGQ